jgi:hypothetical protein
MERMCRPLDRDSDRRRGARFSTPYASRLRPISELYDDNIALHFAVGQGTTHRSRVLALCLFLCLRLIGVIFACVTGFAGTDYGICGTCIWAEGVVTALTESKRIPRFLSITTNTRIFFIFASYVRSMYHSITFQ